MPEAEKPQIYQFGEYKLDVAEESLSRNGERVAVNRRAFQVLRLLVERAGETVTKQEFFEQVWADAFVEDNVLTVTMTALRKALGDNPKEPKFIENLPRKGYRFVGAVTAVDNRTAPAANGEPETVAPKTKVSTPPAPETKVSAPPAPETEAAAPPVSAPLPTFAPAPLAAEKPRAWFGKRKFFFGIGAFCLIAAACVFGLSFFGRSIQKNSPANRAAIESIAVLPFANGNADTAYLSDGLTESVIDNLAALPNLRVISRNSVFGYQGKEIDAAAAGQELNVQAVLTGRFEQRGDDLSISVELTDAHDNRRIWGRQYARRTGDAAALQREIARDVAENLRPKLANAEQPHLISRDTDDAEAFRLFLKGRYEWNKRTHDSFIKAVEFYKQSLERDPTYAPAYIGLANCYMSVDFKDAVTLKERTAMVKAAAEKALEIDPNLGEAYATLAINSHFNEWDWATAEQEYRCAIELSPNYATAHHWYAEFLATEGRFDESFAEYQRAAELDPLSLAVKTDLGLNYYYARQFDRALDYLGKLETFNPNYMRTHFNLAKIYEQKEMFAEAIAETDRGNLLDGLDPQYEAKRKVIFENAFRTAGAKAYWQKCLEVYPAEGQNNPVVLAKVYSALGERDQAFELLEKGYNERSGLLVWLKVSPEFDGVRADPRFDDLVRRIGIPQ